MLEANSKPGIWSPFDSRFGSAFGISQGPAIHFEAFALINYIFINYRDKQDTIKPKILAAENLFLACQHGDHMADGRPETGRQTLAT